MRPLLSLAILTMLTLPAAAGCNTEEKYNTFLAARFGEVLMMRGTIGEDTKQGHWLLYGNAMTGTWTHLAVKKGEACYIASGKSLTPMEAPYVKRTGL